MEIGQVAVFVVILVAVVAALIYQARLAEKRRQTLAAWARARGLSFTPEKDNGYDDRYGFSCLRKGDNRYAHNIMEGTYGAYEACAFDYHYQTHSHDSKGRRQTHTHRFSAVIVTPRFPIKPLSIRGENFFDKVGEFIGMDDIDFELAEFSRQFYVKSPDRRWAFDVLHQEAMEFLLTSPRCTMEFTGSSAIAHDDFTYGAERFDESLKVVTGLLDRLPPSVVQELKANT